jgi:hypothetical protein
MTYAWCDVVVMQISRRAWAGNDNARFAIDKEARHNPTLRVTMAFKADEDLLASLVPDV